jgi:hypothetical protein
MSATTAEREKEQLDPSYISCVGIVSKKKHLPGEAADSYVVARIQPERMDTAFMMTGKENNNILTTGTSGVGKSKLNQWLIYRRPDWRRIFSFKTNDIYDKLGIPVLDMSKATLDPFADPEAFISAFAVSYPHTAGQTTSLVPALLSSILREAKTWAEFDKEISKKLAGAKRELLQSGALTYILTQTQPLRSEKTFSLDELNSCPSAVFDFAPMGNQQAQAFHAEIILRNIWNRMKRESWDRYRLAVKGQGGECVVVVDECHKLLTHGLGTYRSILYEMSREIRDKGSLWSATQNYSDIPPDVRNQFGVQFIFTTKHPIDLKDLGAIDPMLSFTASGLGEHEFTKIESTVHDFVREFKINPAKLKDHPRIEILVKGTTPRKPSDLKAFIRASVDKKGATWRSQIAHEYAEWYHTDEKKIRDALASPIRELINSGEVEVMAVKMGDNTTNVIYRPAGSTGESGLHEWGVNSLVKEEVKKGRRIIHVAKSGEDKPDIETDKEYLEFETGKKKTTADLEKRIRERTDKPFRIVCPNDQVAKEYAQLQNDRVSVEVLRLPSQTTKDE